MATQAQIRINGVPGSDDDLPINTVVLLTNNGLGGETTFAWSIVEQPPGPADLLIGPTLPNPTFTPRKEGTYLVRLVVNAALADEKTDQVVAGIRHLKSRMRVPAPSETDETNSDGWAEPAVNTSLRLLDTDVADPSVLVGVAGTAGLLRGQVVRCSGTATIKVGLPGEEKLPSFALAHANVLAELSGRLGILEGGVDGSTSPANGDLVRVRMAGRFAGASGGAPAVGDSVFLSDAGAMVLTPGTFAFKVGIVASVPSPTWDVWVAATGVATAAGLRLLTVSVPPVVGDPPIDVGNIAGTDGPISFRSLSTGVSALKVRKLSGQTADLFLADDPTAAVKLFRVRFDGSLDVGDRTGAVVPSGDAFRFTKTTSDGTAVLRITGTPVNQLVRIDNDGDGNSQQLHFGGYGSVHFEQDLLEYASLGTSGLVTQRTKLDVGAANPDVIFVEADAGANPTEGLRIRRENNGIGQSARLVIGDRTATSGLTPQLRLDAWDGAAAYDAFAKLQTTAGHPLLFGTNTSALTTTAQFDYPVGVELLQGDLGFTHATANQTILKTGTGQLRLNVLAGELRLTTLAAVEIGLYTSATKRWSVLGTGGLAAGGAGYPITNTSGVELTSGDVTFANGAVQQISKATGTLSVLAVGGQLDLDAGTVLDMSGSSANLVTTGAGGLSISATGAGELSAFATGAAAYFGTNGAFSAFLRSSGVNRWAVLSTGEFAAQGGNRAIQNVLDPVAAQDATTKNYVDVTKAATATPANLATAAAVGTGTRYAKEDHVHRSSVIQSASVRLATDPTTTSATFVTLLSLGVTTLAGATVVMEAHVCASNTGAANTNDFRLTVDGVVRAGGQTRSPAANVSAGMSFTHRETGLTAAAHTILLEWRTSGGTLRVNALTNPDTESAQITAVEYATPAA